MTKVSNHQDIDGGQFQPLLSERHIPELDGLRGIAVLMVIMWHSTGSMVDQGLGGMSALAYAVTIFGRTGVDLFFVLSGFLIIGILIDRRESKNRVAVFYARRAARIIPAYIVLIIVFWICHVFIGGTSSFNAPGGVIPELIAQLTFTYNIAMTLANESLAKGFSVTWSVDVEEWFYIIVPAIIWFVRPNKIWSLLLAAALVSAAARALSALIFPDWQYGPYILLPFRLDGLCLGGLLALAFRSEFAHLWVRRHRRLVLSSALVGTLSIPILIGVIRNNLLVHMFIWGHLFLAVIYAILIASVIFQASFKKILQNKFLRTCGKYSYSLYLFHPLYLEAVFVIAGRQVRYNEPVDFILVMLALFITALFCIILYRFVENPIRQIGRRAKYA